MTRILRYLGNREKPEENLYGRVDFPIQRRSVLGPAVKYNVDDETIPNLIDFGMEKAGPLFLPKSVRIDPFGTATGFLNSYYNIQPYFGLSRYLMGSWDDAKLVEEKPKVESAFEVNMMEALVGWKALSVNEGVVYSASMAGVPWPVDTPLEAICKNGKPHVDAPYEHCSCGIYASDGREGAEEYRSSHDPEDFIAMVYGWGKYVRGNNGWRSQYAYPKCFYLQRAQVPLIEQLKSYHVPIYIEQPTLIYNPEEDGYEYRREEADWDSRADQESVASEEGDEDASADED